MPEFGANQRDTSIFQSKLLDPFGTRKRFGGHPNLKIGAAPEAPPKTTVTNAITKRYHRFDVDG